MILVRYDEEERKKERKKERIINFASLLSVSSLLLNIFLRPLGFLFYNLLRSLFASYLFL